jgi:hypothetical protein
MKKSLENLRLNIFNIMLTIAVLARLLPSDIQQDTQLSVAYLDPGTGTMIISAIVGVFATIILGVKTFWFKIASFFKSKKKK